MRVAFFVSGTGTNLEAILDAHEQGVLAIEPVVAIGNNSKARSMQLAGDRGLAVVHMSSHTHPNADELDVAIADALAAHDVELVVLAGYAKQLGPKTIAAFRNRIINTHPGPLPLTGGPGMFGMAVHTKVIESGLSESCITVHLVDEEYDHGAVIATRSVPVLDEDTPDTLATRLKAEENRFLPEVLAQIVTGTIALPS